MKTPMIFSTFILTLQIVSANAQAQSCEQKHKEALEKLISQVQKNKNTDLVNVLLNGKNSGIDVYNLEPAETKRIFRESDMIFIGVDMQRTLSEPNCNLCNYKQFEAFKRQVKPTGSPGYQFAADSIAQGWNSLLGNKTVQVGSVQMSPVEVKPADFTTAIRLLNSQGGLKGMSAKIDTLSGGTASSEAASCQDNQTVVAHETAANEAAKSDESAPSEAPVTENQEIEN